MDNCKVVSLLNFSSVTDGKHLTCRDLDGDMPEPALKQNIEVKILAPAAKKVWVASPDFLAGAPQELAFEQSGDYVTLTVPSLSKTTPWCSSRPRWLWARLSTADGTLRTQP